MQFWPMIPLSLDVIWSQHHSHQNGFRVIFPGPGVGRGEPDIHLGIRFMKVAKNQ